MAIIKILSDGLGEKKGTEGGGLVALGYLLTLKK
jgi:hypothetical protein